VLLLPVMEQFKISLVVNSFLRRLSTTLVIGSVDLINYLISLIVWPLYNVSLLT
jgi:hypothetical protein